MTDTAPDRVNDIDPDRGQPLPGWGLLKAVRKARDRTAALQSALERLNAVDPQLARVEKAKESVLAAYRQARKHLQRGKDSAAKLNIERRSTSLEVALRVLHDRAEGQPNPYFLDRRVERLIIKEKDFVVRAYDRVPFVCSLSSDAINKFRACWVFTCVAITRAVFLKHRHAAACEIINLLASDAIDYYTAYYYARKLTSMSISSAPLEFDIRPGSFDGFIDRFRVVEENTEKVFDRIFKYQSNSTFHTINKRDALVKMVKRIAEDVRELELHIIETAQWRPVPPWPDGSLPRLDRNNLEYLEQL